jgi:ATP-dependent DNA ligase
MRSRGLTAFVEPCLPSPVKRPPAGSNWIHEIKHDGFRIMARRDAVGVRLFTRTGHDFTARFPLAAAAVTSLPGRSFLIDGEAIVTDDKGLAVFEFVRRARHGGNAVLCAFDLIELDGEDLRRRPIEDRKRKLSRLIRTPASGYCSERTLRGRRRNRVSARLPARLRGHRVQTARLAISFRPRRLLGEGEKPEGAGGEARVRRRLGPPALRCRPRGASAIGGRLPQ